MQHSTGGKMAGDKQMNGIIEDGTTKMEFMMEFLKVITVQGDLEDNGEKELQMRTGYMPRTRRGGIVFSNY